MYVVLIILLVLLCASVYYVWYLRKAVKDLERLLHVDMVRALRVRSATSFLDKLPSVGEPVDSFWGDLDDE